MKKERRIGAARYLPGKGLIVGPRGQQRITTMPARLLDLVADALAQGDPIVRRETALKRLYSDRPAPASDTPRSVMASLRRKLDAAGAELEIAAVRNVGWLVRLR